MPELPHGWVWTTIGEVTQQIEKVRPKENPDTQFTYVDISSIDNQINKVVEPKTYYGSEAPSRARQLVRANDVLFSTVRTYLKNVALVPEICDGQIASTGFSVLRGESDISPKYIFYCSLTDQFINPLSKLQRGTSYPAVRDSDVRAQPIPLPPAAEQQRIVARIEELFTQLDAGVAALEKARAQLRRYRQAVLKAAVEGELTREWREAHQGEFEPASVLLERVEEERKKQAKRSREKLPLVDTPELPDLPEGWTWARVIDVTESMRNGIYKPKNYYSDDGIACLRMYNIEDGLIVWKDIKRMILTPDEINEYGLKPGDILVNRVNSRELVGKSAVIPSGLETCVYESKNIRLRLYGESVESKYANFWFQVFSRQYFSRNAQQTVGMASINQTQLGSMPIPIPPLLEQHKIVDEVERLLSVAYEVEKTIEQGLKRAERLRQSILKQAFEGKLVPQDPGDEPASVLLERIQAEKARHEAQKKAKKRSRKKEAPRQLGLL